ncbi:MAG: hypothetical protein R2744_10420 [Bacteroidales bacterium]
MKTAIVIRTMAPTRASGESFFMISFFIVASMASCKGIILSCFTAITNASG